MRVAILPTGHMELLALGKALKRRFPEHEFVTIRQGTGEPFSGFCSGRLPVPPGPKANPALVRIVQQAASLADDPRYSLILILDDLELDNADQPQIGIASVRHYFEAHLLELSQRLDGASVSKIRKAIQDKVSFHSAVTMIESWLFADPLGAQRAGAEQSRLPPKLQPNLDPEGLRFVDPAYLSDQGAQCTCWQKLSPKKQIEHRPMWLKQGIDERRSEHPKAAMAWLCINGDEKKCTNYQETHGGAIGLEGLDWATILANGEHMRFLRSMNNDLSELFNDPDNFSKGKTATETELKIRQPNRVLRNV